MIIVDIETGGINKEKCGIWQIGAIDLTTGEEFLDEGRLDDEDILFVDGKKSAIEVIGKTEEYLRDRKKQSQKELLTNFLKWVNKRSIKNFLCQNPQFDVAFIEIKARKYGLETPFHHRSFDLHSIAQTKYKEIKGDFLMKNDTNGIHSNMGLTNILKFCGMSDNRGVHNALEDCKLTGECFSRLIYGKNLFPEYSKFKIPDYLKQASKK